MATSRPEDQGLSPGASLLPRLPRNVSGQKAVSVFRKLGFDFVRQRGSHIIMRRLSPEGNDVVVIPDHDYLAVGTLKKILQKGDISTDEFISML